MTVFFPIICFHFPVLNTICSVIPLVIVKSEKLLIFSNKIPYLSHLYSLFIILRIVGKQNEGMIR